MEFDTLDGYRSSAVCSAIPGQTPAPVRLWVQAAHERQSIKV